jgi:hypothetical protein
MRAGDFVDYRRKKASIVAIDALMFRIDDEGIE